MDAVYPGKVAMSKVNFEARYDYEYVGNYKVLQNVFDKQGVNKVRRRDPPVLRRRISRERLRFENERVRV